LFPIDDFCFCSIEKIIIPCSYPAPFVPPNLLHTHYNLYLANSLADAVSEPALYRLLTFQVPNLMSLFRCLGHTTVSAQVRGSGIYFVTGYIFTVRSC